MTEQMRKWVCYYLFLTMLVSSFVSSEPAPYDLLMIVFIIAGFLLSFYKITREIVFPIVVVCVFLISNLISLFFVKEMGGSLLFTGITFYLALTWIALVTLGQKMKQLDIQLIFKGYLISALFAAIVGILAYFQMIPSSDEFLMFGRSKAFFKDPNVFGPFLVMPTLFSLSMTEIEKTSIIRKVIYFTVFSLLIMGILLSFSRGAWGNFAISFAIYLILLKKEAIRGRINTILVLFLVGVPMFLYFVQTPMVEDLLVARFSYQGYDDNRFDTQRIVFSAGLSNPLGVGGGQSDNLVQKSPHNLYARVFTENGVFGIVSLILLFLFSTIRAYKSYRISKDQSGVLFLIIFASLVGLSFNSFFVDTLHWRHFWLLLALAWIPCEAKKAGK